MNTLVKTAVAGALALGATSAFAIGVPSSNSSDLILYVDAFSGTSVAGVYAYDTGISLSSLMSGGFVSGASNNSTAFTGLNKSTTAGPGFASFVSSHAGDTFSWTIEGGQYVNPTFAAGTPTAAGNANNVQPGTALAIFTSPTLTSVLPKASTATTVNFYNFLNGLQNDITSGSMTGLQTATETTATAEGPNLPQNKYAFLAGPDLAATGSTAVSLFGFTGNGVNGGTLQSYLLGTVSFTSAGALTFSQNPTGTPVPLPAAVWLFGSGLMGLVGVSRRRKAAQA